MLDEQWLATFAAVGVIPAPNQWRPTGARVFVAHQDIVWLVTAHHGVPRDGTGFGVLVPVKGQRTLFDVTDILKTMVERIKNAAA